MWKTLGRSLHHAIPVHSLHSFIPRLGLSTYPPLSPVEGRSWIVEAFLLSVGCPVISRRVKHAKRFFFLLSPEANYSSLNSVEVRGAAVVQSRTGLEIIIENCRSLRSSFREAGISLWSELSVVE